MRVQHPDLSKFKYCQRIWDLETPASRCIFTGGQVNGGSSRDDLITRLAVLADQFLPSACTF